MDGATITLDRRPASADLPLTDLAYDVTAPPRKLVESMGMLGQKRPILAYPDGEGKYVVVDGKRRSEAALQLGWETVWALVYPDQLSAEGAAETALVGNFVRGENPVDDALNAALIGEERALEIAGMSKAQFKALTHVLKLAPKFLDMVRRGDLPITAAREMAKLTHAQQDLAYQAAVAASLASPRKRVTVKMIKTAVRGIRFPPGQQVELPLPDMQAGGDANGQERSEKRILGVTYSGLGTLVERAAVMHPDLNEEDANTLIRAAWILQQR